MAINFLLWFVSSWSQSEAESTVTCGKTSDARLVIVVDTVSESQRSQRDWWQAEHCEVMWAGERWISEQARWDGHTASLSLALVVTGVDGDGEGCSSARQTDKAQKASWASCTAHVWAKRSEDKQVAKEGNDIRVAKVESCKWLHATFWCNGEVTLHFHLGWTRDEIVESIEGNLAKDEFLDQLGHLLGSCWHVSLHVSQSWASSGCQTIHIVLSFTLVIILT